MAKINWVFQDESGTNLNRYIATNVETGEQITFDLLRGGNINVIGTPLNAETLNQLITAINDNYDKFENFVDLTSNQTINGIKTFSMTMKTQDIYPNTSSCWLGESSNPYSQGHINNVYAQNLYDKTTKNYITPQEIINAKNDVSTLKSENTTNKSNISKNTTNISNLQKQLNELDYVGSSDLTKVNQDIADINERLQSAINKGYSNEDKIADVNSDIDTINSRLDKLGFKTGTFTVTSSAYDVQTGSVISSNDLNKYIEYNSIKKQGKYCIATFKLDPLEDSKVYSFTLSLHIPDGFVPKSTFGFYARISRLKTVNNIPIQEEYPLWVTNSSDKSVFTISVENLAFSMFRIGWETN